MKINAIKANGVEYDIWATESDVQALNNQGNAALGKELDSGKAMIAQAINNVGGQASEDESLAELAEDITTMPIVNVSAFKFSEVPNLAKQIAEQTYSEQLGEDFRTKLTEINDVNGEITSVGAYAFNRCNNLVKINLPNVTTIGYNAFNSCTNLTDINIPKGIANDSFVRGNINLNNLVIGEFKSKFIFSPATPAGAEQSLVNLIITQSLTYDLDDSVGSYNINRYPKLIKLLIPTDTDFTAFKATRWTASTYLVNSADQWENRLTLYTNLLEYTLKRLYDHSEDGVTRTFRLGFYATLFADSQLNTEPYGSYYTPLIKAAAQACIDEATRRGWTLSA